MSNADATGTLPTEITLSGVRYLVLSAKAYNYNGATRHEFTLQRPRGKRSYYAVRYENGAWSDAV